MSRTERLMLVERGPSELTLPQQADLLSVSRARLYYRPVPPSAEEIAIKHRLDELYTDFPSYGSRKLAVLLRPTWSISRKRVQRYMRQMGLVAIYPGPKTSQPAPVYLANANEKTNDRNEQTTTNKQLPTTANQG